MKGRVIEKLMAVACALCLAGGVMSGVVSARGEEIAEPEASPEATFVVLDAYAEETAVPTAQILDNRTTIPLTVGGEQRGVCSIVDGDLYMAPADFCQAMGLGAQSSSSGGVYTVTADGVSIRAEIGSPYFACNGRYLYLKDGVISEGGQVILPLELLAKCLGVTAVWDPIGWVAAILEDTASPLESGDTYYGETDVYWLSHVIYAEAGNQSLLGKIAVGSVVLNRMADEAFVGQDTVYDVIFAKNQFEVVINGMIYMEPDSDAVIAAKIALEGADVVDGATYFATYFFGDGYDCVMWIEDHCFMTSA